MVEKLGREGVARLLLKALQFRDETIDFNRDQDTHRWRDALLQADAVLGASVIMQAQREGTKP